MNIMAVILIDDGHSSIGYKRPRLVLTSDAPSASV